ncbi:tetratricopeptide repeat protein [Photobacterium swingsii]|uniref:tetratricopeptide repeat protein n=1 Tax=Photobacterium swingsii TaxID=680026 RepID=UPI004067911A
MPKKKAKKKGLSLQSKIAQQIVSLRKQPSQKVVSRKGKASKAEVRPELILSQTRGLPQRESLHTLSNMLVDRATRDSAIDCKFPSDYKIKSNLRYANSEHGLEFDIAFESSILLSFADDISNFLRLSRAYDTSLLISDLESAKQILSEIKERFGYSNWYISSKLNLYYEKGEHKLANEFRNEVSDYFEKNKTSSLSEVYANYPFIRCDKGVSYERYSFSIQHQSEELSLESESDIIHFSHFYSPSKTYTDYSNVIGENSANNIIDRYLGFRRVLASCYLHGKSFENCLSSISNLSNKIDDNSLKNIVRSIKGVDIDYDGNDKQLIKICDLYIQGNYLNVVRMSESLLKDNPTFTSVNEIYIKSLIRCNLNSNLSSLIGDICNEVKGLYLSEDKKKVISNLQKYYLRFYHCDWAYFIKLHFEKFAHKIEESKIEFLYKYIDLNSSLANPFSELFLYSTIDKENDHLLYKILNSDQNEIRQLKYVEPNRKLKILGDNYFKGMEYIEAIKTFEELSTCEDFLLSEHAKSHLISCYFKIGDIDKAINELAIIIVEGKGQSLLPLGDIYKYINEEEKSVLSLEQLLNRSIVTHQYYSVQGSEEGEIISLICEDILDLLEINESDDVYIPEGELYFHFFKKVLTPSVLEKIDIFDSLEDVYIFRFYILKELMSSSDDIKLRSDLFRNIEKLIKETCVIECGLGKIEVDTLSIKNNLTESLKVTFELIKSSEKKPILESDFSEVINDKGSYTISSNKFFVDVLDLYYQIRDAFTLSPAYGLDYFLNMNIRHGGIVNLLWGPAKTHKLCYLKTEKGHFEKEQYWFDHNPYMNAETRELLDNSLRKFSRKLDKKIQETKSYIHINTGEFQDDDKAFNYFTVQDYIEELSGSINDTTVIDEFLDMVIKELISTTDNCLSEIKEKFNTKLRDEINTLFDDLKNEVSKSRYKFDELIRKIKLAQREVNEQLDELMEWMAWKNEASQSFYCGSAIEAAKDMILNLHPNRVINVNIIDEHKGLLKGEHFRKFVMIYLILMDNAIVHSRKDSIENIGFHISPKSEGMNIVVTNKIDRLDSSITEEKVADVNSKINTEYINDANKESGSGLFKIKKVISNDIKVKNNISLSLDGELFSVHIDIKEGSICE